MRFLFAWLLLTLAPAAIAAAPRAPVSPTEPAKNKAAVAAKSAPAPAPGSIIAAPDQTRALRIGVFDRKDGTSAGYRFIVARSKVLSGTVVTPLAPHEFATRDLREFDVIVFPGGSARVQASSLGAKGIAAVKRYVAEGGNYLGICAGAYLACSGDGARLGLLNARTLSPNWKRGRARLDLALTEEGRTIFGDVDAPFSVSYVNGPVFGPAGRTDLPEFVTDAVFRTEIAENGTPAGIMKGSPAFARGTFGRGRVFISSPHPEATRGLENVIPRALLWLTDRS